MPRPPFVVLLEGVAVGDVRDYGYETPWATGQFVARSGTDGEQLRSATAIDELVETDPELADETLEAECVRLG
jgi:hypothetical protein